MCRNNYDDMTEHCSTWAEFIKALLVYHFFFFFKLKNGFLYLGGFNYFKRQEIWDGIKKNNPKSNWRIP